MTANGLTASHADWVNEILKSREVTAENAAEILREEIGKVFGRVLADAGVYKCTEKGRADFNKFINSVNE